MRLLSQAINPALKGNIKDCKQVIGAAFYNFNARRQIQFNQPAEDVKDEFKEISNAALDFEDDLLTKEMEKITKMILAAVGEDKKVKDNKKDEEILIGKQKLMIKELRQFVKEGFVGENSESSGQK